jgi:acyl dehydratase
MRLVYFEDLHEGDVYWGDEVLVDPDEMMAYNLKNDPWPLHVDQEAAKRTPYGGIIASGGYTITLMYRSCIGINNNAETRWEFLGGFDWKLKFVTPVRPGDRLRVKMTIKSTRPSSKGGRGVINSVNEVLNQDGETVMSLDVVFLLATKPVLDSGRQ